VIAETIAKSFNLLQEWLKPSIAETIQKPNGSLILQEVVFNPEKSANMIHKN